MRKEKRKRERMVYNMYSCIMKYAVIYLLKYYTLKRGPQKKVLSGKFIPTFFSIFCERKKHKESVSQ